MRQQAINAGTAPDIPRVMTNWHHGLHLEVVLLEVAHIGQDMLNLHVGSHCHLCFVSRPLLHKCSHKVCCWQQQHRLAHHTRDIAHPGSSTCTTVQTLSYVVECVDVHVVLATLLCFHIQLRYHRAAALA